MERWYSNSKPSLRQQIYELKKDVKEKINEITQLEWDLRKERKLKDQLQQELSQTNQKVQQMEQNWKEEINCHLEVLEVARKWKERVLDEVKRNYGDIVLEKNNELEDLEHKIWQLETQLEEEIKQKDYDHQLKIANEKINNLKGKLALINKEFTVFKKTSQLNQLRKNLVKRFKQIIHYQKTKVELAAQIQIPPK